MKKFLSSLLIVLLACGELFAAIDVRTVWEVNASATSGNVNGGGFNPYATANMLTDLACTSATGSSPVCSSASYNFVAGDVGHWLYVTVTGDWTANFCQIASVASNQATLTAGAGTCNVIGVPNWTTNTSAGIASAASPTGGVFAVDRSRSTAAAQTSTTATNTAGVITVGSLTFNKTYVGTICQIVAGTGATQGWYQVTDAVAATSFTLDRDPSGTTNISINCGGAISLGSNTGNRTDDEFFELGSGTNGTGASRFFVKSGSYTMGGTVSTLAAGGTLTPVTLYGYQTIRGDVPTGTNRPLLAFGANNYVQGPQWWVSGLRVTGTSATLWGLNGGTVVTNAQVINSSTTANRIAIQTFTDSALRNIEAVSYFGTAVDLSSTNATMERSWIHDSQTCVLMSPTTSTQAVVNTLVSGCVTYGFNLNASTTTRTLLTNNTIYGAENKLGTGINIAAGVTDLAVTNTMLIGLATGITHAAVQSMGFDRCNDYYNNTADVNGWSKGPDSIAVNPSFASVGQITGTTATYTGTTLTQSGGDFTNVTDGTYILIKSGTGLTTANSIAKINSHTTTTIVTDIDLGESSASNWTYQITTGLNFVPTGSVTGCPTFQGGYSTNNSAIGALQKATTSSGGGGIIGQ